MEQFYEIEELLRGIVDQVCDDADIFFEIERNPVSALAFSHVPSTSNNSEKLNRKLGDDFSAVFDGMVNDIADRKMDCEVRRAPSLVSYGCDSDSDFEETDSENELDFLHHQSGTASDSEAEFDRLVRTSHRHLKQIHKKEYQKGPPSTKRHRPTPQIKEDNVHEYDSLPPLEKLNINCDNAEMSPFGTVVRAVDCLIVIEPVCKEVLDFDSCLFDDKKQAIGKVFDVFGPVKEPLYSVRFNSAEEASMIPIGMKIFYAAGYDELSKTPYKGLNLENINRDQLANINKKLDRELLLQRTNHKTNEKEVDSGSDCAFSDDDEEKAFSQQKKAQPIRNQANQRGNQKRRNRGNHSVRFADGFQSPYVPARNENQRGGHQNFNHNDRAGIWNWNNSRQTVPYRRDFDAVPSSAAAPAPSPAAAKLATESKNPPTPTTDDSNPYAEYGCYGGIAGRFGF